jgi:hypothetical protein
MLISCTSSCITIVVPRTAISKLSIRCLTKSTQLASNLLDRTFDSPTFDSVFKCHAAVVAAAAAAAIRLLASIASILTELTHLSLRYLYSLIYLTA